MSPRVARGLAWVVWALAMVFVAGPVAQIVLNSFGPDALLFWVGFVGVQLCTASAGLVITLHHPGHAVGWIFLAMGAGIGLVMSLGAYAQLGMGTSAGPLPGDVAAAWLSGWLFIPVQYGLVLLLLLLFPTGHFLSVRWRVVGGMIGVVVLAASAASAFVPGRYDSTVTIVNPLGASGVWGTLMTELEAVTNFLALPAFLGAVGGLVVRFRRAEEVERQQLKWFSYVGVLVGVGLAGSIIVPAEGLAEVLILVGLLALMGLPVAAGVAILRHRLYDIDLVINRTLVYGALTATLGAAYLGMVLGLQWALSPLTADSGLAVAGSTLAVAALFGPVRARIQGVVDRRFYRRRYDATRTLEAFGVRLRDELDLEALGDDLRGVVRDTVQPAYVSLWLREVPR